MELTPVLELRQLIPLLIPRKLNRQLKLILRHINMSRIPLTINKMHRIRAYRPATLLLHPRAQDKVAIHHPPTLTKLQPRQVVGEVRPILLLFLRRVRVRVVTFLPTAPALRPAGRPPRRAAAAVPVQRRPLPAAQLDAAAAREGVHAGAQGPGAGGRVVAGEVFARVALVAGGEAAARCGRSQLSAEEARKQL